MMVSPVPAVAGDHRVHDLLCVNRLLRQCVAVLCPVEAIARTVASGGHEKTANRISDGGYIPLEISWRAQSGLVQPWA